jgi:hypothetical protein
VGAMIAAMIKAADAMRGMAGSGLDGPMPDNLIGAAGFLQSPRKAPSPSKPNIRADITAGVKFIRSWSQAVF